MHAGDEECDAQVSPETALYVAPLFVSLAVLGGLLVITWFSRSDPIAPWFAATLLAILIWTFGYIFEIASPDLGAKVSWANFQFVGVVTLPVVWLEVVRRFAGLKPLPRAVHFAVVAYVVLSIAVIATNPGGAYRGTPSLDTSVTPPMLIPDYGWYWAGVIMPGIYVLFCAIVVILVRAAVRETSSARRLQYVLLVLAGVLPLLAGTLFIFGITPAHGFNPTTAIISVSGAIMAYVLFRYRLWDIAPIARWSVVEGLSDGVIVLDVQDRVVDFNPPARRLFPDLDMAVVGRPIAEVLAFHPGILRSISEVPAGESVKESVLADLSMSVLGDAAERADGLEIRHFTLTLTDVRSRTGRLLGRSLLLHDMTENHELRQQVERLSTTDRLTEFLTRGAFLEAAENELARARRQGFSIWVICLDLDHFGLVNDVFGATLGDDVLRAAARVCRRTTRSFDVVGRYGATFVILMPHASCEEAERTAEKLRQAVESFLIYRDDQAVTVTASVGWAGTECVRGEHLNDLLEPAQQALRQAHEEGGNRVVASGMGCQDELRL